MPSKHPNGPGLATRSRTSKAALPASPDASPAVGADGNDMIPWSPTPPATQDRIIGSQMERPEFNEEGESEVISSDTVNSDEDMDNLEFKEQEPLSDDHLPSFPGSPRSPSPPPPRNAREWPYEVNVALARALDAHEPLTAAYGSTTRAWASVQHDLQRAVGKKFGIDTIKKHAHALVAAHRKADAAAMKKSGATEDVSELTTLMGQIVGLIDDESLNKTHKSRQAQSKADLERLAGIQARNAAAKGCVDREEWCDITNAPGATPREKMAQRQKRKRSASPVDKENDPAASASGSQKSQRKRRRQDDGVSELAEILEQQNEANRKMLATLKQEQAAFTQTLQTFLQAVSTGSGRNEAAEHESLRREEEERRREERREEREERREAQRREEQQQFMQMMAMMFQSGRKD